ncbi:MAG: FG-GAP repeat protein, partial [Sedimentisphaerales bacterium]
GENWTQQAKLTASDGIGDELFGCSVSIDDEYSVVSAYIDEDYGPESGSAYIFRREGQNWKQEAKLIAPDGHSYHQFGRGVSISDGYVIAGAPLDEDIADSAGAAYIFSRVSNTWSH